MADHMAPAALCITLSTLTHSHHTDSSLAGLLALSTLTHFGMPTHTENADSTGNDDSF